MANTINTPLHSGDVSAPATVPDLTAECKRWEQRHADAQAECDRLRAELAKTQAERDQYLKSLSYYIGKELESPTFTKEEVFEALRNGSTLDKLLAEMKREYGLE